MYQILIMLIPFIYSHCTEREFQIFNMNNFAMYYKHL